MSNKDLYIRSSSAEFLIFEQQKKEHGIEVRFEDGDLWLTQKALGELFNTTRNNITMHLQDIYSSNELDEISTSKDFLLVQKEGNREVKRKVKYYNLDAIISVGFAPSKGQARQLINQGGITLNDNKISDTNYILSDSDFNDGFAILKKGKKSFYKLIKTN